MKKNIHHIKYMKEQAFFMLPFCDDTIQHFPIFFHTVIPNTFLSVTTTPDFSFLFVLGERMEGLYFYCHDFVTKLFKFFFHKIVPNTPTSNLLFTFLSYSSLQL